MMLPPSIARLTTVYQSPQDLARRLLVTLNDVTADAVTHQIRSISAPVPSSRDCGGIVTGADLNDNGPNPLVRGCRGQSMSSTLAIFDRPI